LNPERILRFQFGDRIPGDTKSLLFSHEQRKSLCACSINEICYVNCAAKDAKQSAPHLELRLRPLLPSSNVSQYSYVQMAPLRIHYTIQQQQQAASH
jgi:hypothetical protein